MIENQLREVAKRGVTNSGTQRITTTIAKQIVSGKQVEPAPKETESVQGYNARQSNRESAREYPIIVQLRRRTSSQRPDIREQSYLNVKIELFAKKGEVHIRTQKREKNGHNMSTWRSETARSIVLASLCRVLDSADTVLWRNQRVLRDCNPSTTVPQCQTQAALEERQCLTFNSPAVGSLPIAAVKKTDVGQKPT